MPLAPVLSTAEACLLLQYVNALLAYSASATSCANAAGGLVSWNSNMEQLLVERYFAGARGRCCPVA